ncbi:MAG: hypothetical protein LJE59_16560 [Chromatiaceae bacterium]|nr:hypothetical protein [Chromatiaceae bacterium]
MLKNIGKVSILLRLGSRVCVCLRNDRLDPRLRARIRPLVIGGLAFWCDRSTAA